MLAMMEAALISPGRGEISDDLTLIHAKLRFIRFFIIVLVIFVNTNGIPASCRRCLHA